MVRLTPELVAKSPSHINPLKERELEFRGMAIQTIENLGAFQGGYDCLNLSDNALTTVANIPLSTRLQSIILANNSITSISLSLPVSVPNLTTLNLTGNSIASLSALVPLENCKSLRYLHLGGNPVKNEQYYREFCIWKVAAGQLHVLDYTRIKDQERTAAKDLFLTPPPHSQPNSLATSLLTSSKTTSSSAATLVTGSGSSGVQNGQKGRLMSEEDREKVKQAILKAGSTEEVRSLERMLAEGHVPEGKDL